MAGRMRPMDEIIAAAKAAEAHDFVVEFADGYDTQVGERGVTLSGGQKQRIAIARALLLDPRILILDDSTSSVDVETEFRIQQALDKLMVGRTSFVIAQRISTVRDADADPGPGWRAHCGGGYPRGADARQRHLCRNL